VYSRLACGGVTPDLLRGTVTSVRLWCVDWVVGADRVAAVSRLRQIFASPVPRVAVLVASPGAGRTYVLEQLFKVFLRRSDDFDECYWPKELVACR
jgi:hypothetical protein